MILIINFLYDFILLLCVSIILKRNTKIYRIILGGFVGSITTLSLFINMNNITLFIFKIIVSLLMILICFGKRSIKHFIKNTYYLYLCSCILGGTLYMINNEFLYKNDGFLFISSETQINIILALIFSPIILYLYIKQNKDLRINYNKYHNVKLLINGKEIVLNAFLDTGNKLKDPYKQRPIILVNNNLFDYSSYNYLLVPYYTLENEGMLKCIKADKLFIDNKLVKSKFLIGLTNKINIDGVDCILNERLLEG